MARPVPPLSPISCPLSTRSPCLHLDFRQVKVESQQSLSVIEHHTITFKIQRARQQNRSRVGGGNRRPSRNREIQSLMHALNFAVKGSPGTENIGDRARPLAREIFPTTPAPDLVW